MGGWTQPGLKSQVLDLLILCWRPSRVNHRKIMSLVFLVSVFPFEELGDLLPFFFYRAYFDELLIKVKCRLF